MIRQYRKKRRADGGYGGRDWKGVNSLCRRFKRRIQSRMEKDLCWLYHSEHADPRYRTAKDENKPTNTPAQLTYEYLVTVARKLSMTDAENKFMARNKKLRGRNRRPVLLT